MVEIFHIETIRKNKQRIIWGIHQWVFNHLQLKINKPRWSAFILRSNWLLFYCREVYSLYEIQKLVAKEIKAAPVYGPIVSIGFCLWSVVMYTRFTYKYNIYLLQKSSGLRLKIQYLLIRLWPLQFRWSFKTITYILIMILAWHWSLKDVQFHLNLFIQSFPNLLPRFSTNKNVLKCHLFQWNKIRYSIDIQSRCAFMRPSAKIDVIQCLDLVFVYRDRRQTTKPRAYQ